MDLLDSEGKAAVFRFAVLPRVNMGKFAGSLIGMAGRSCQILLVRSRKGQASQAGISAF